LKGAITGDREAVALPPEERRDRVKVNEAVRDGLRFGPLRPAGGANLYEVLKAPRDAGVIEAFG
jgi:hypothetical protein